MSNHGVKHDYHIINPSPWPLMGSASAVLWGLGLVVWWRGLLGIPKGEWWLFAIGMAGILLTMVFWWRDVIKESRRGDHTPVVQIGLRYGMIMFIASEVMFFVAFFWMFFEMALFAGHRSGVDSGIEEVRAAWSTWPPAGVETLDPWHLPLLNTLLLYDPAAELKKIRVPVLGLFGSLDHQVPAEENAAALRKGLAGNPDVTIVIMPGFNHLFQHAKTGSVAEWSTLREVGGSDPEFLKIITDWVAKRTGAAAP